MNEEFSTNLNTHTPHRPPQSEVDSFILDDSEFNEDDYLKWVEMIDTCLGEL